MQTGKLLRDSELSLQISIIYVRPASNKTRILPSREVDSHKTQLSISGLSLD